MDVVDEKVRKESFRDAISTVDKAGKRVWVYPKKPKGKYTTAREIVGFLLLALMFSGPFIKISGEPLLLLNILERKFIFFGQVFWPQDFHLFLLGMLAMIVFVVVFTVVYGRVFCGWVCPQTIFMEVVFRKVEYWIEGDYKRQMLLDKAGWNREKVFKKGLKQFIFFALSFLIANTFLAYIIGIEELKALITTPPQENWSGFLAMLVFTLVFYWIYASFREQVCTTVCPYGRLQGVLLDRNSVVVAYDYVRGERRGKIRKNEDRKDAHKGDCIDCGQCVNVCPTGIDIRNGTQMECINCTACIDACNFMMEKVGLPQNLIRYDSEEGIANRREFRFTKRMAAYTAILVLLCSSLMVLLLSRSVVETTVLRTPGMLYQEQENGMVSNLYNIKLINKSNNDLPIEFRLENVQGEIKMVGGKDMYLQKQSMTDGVLFILLDKSEINSTRTKIVLGIYSGDKHLENVTTSFIGPAKSN